ncbi:MAG: hypothetical protein R2847_09160 [Bacteroidia bacterium]
MNMLKGCFILTFNKVKTLCILSYLAASNPDIMNLRYYIMTTVFCCFLTTAQLHAQSIKGKITDNNNVSHLQVLCSMPRVFPDSSLVKAAVADAGGNYIFDHIKSAIISLKHRFCFENYKTVIIRLKLLLKNSLGYSTESFFTT